MMCSGKILKRKNICILGSGNWATTVARIVGLNAAKHDSLNDIVAMYVYEEIVNGRKLSDIINEDHENVKYLPGYKIPENVIAIPDIVTAVKDADAIIFIIPHRVVRNMCANLHGNIKSTVCALSMVKGFERAEDGGIQLISKTIKKLLHINVSVLMGANVAGEIASGLFAEATLGCRSKKVGQMWSDILAGDNFHITLTDDITSVEIYSGLKNIVAIGAGIIDGLEYGHNTKATMMRMSIAEIIKFVDTFYPGGKLSTFFESCGIGDVVTTCYGSRNRRVAEISVKTGKDMQTLERELLRGQELRGPYAAAEVYGMLKNKGIEASFPVLSAIHRICTGKMKAGQLVEVMKSYSDATLKLENITL